MTCALMAAPAVGWTPAMQAVIAQEGARLAPPDLYRQIDRHRSELLAGVRAPFGDGDPTRHVGNADGSGKLDRVIQEEADRTVEAIRSHAPFAAIVRQMGVVAHYVADANNPLNVSRADAREGEYFADYLHYTESVEPRLPLIFYGMLPGLDEMESLEPLLERTFRRGRTLYPNIGREYRRIGFASGIGRFDDRSSAFGTTALAFHHAVTDVAQVMRWIWVRAGGIDERGALPRRGEEAVRLPRYDPDSDPPPPHRGR